MKTDAPSTNWPDLIEKLVDEIVVLRERVAYLLRDQYEKENNR